MKGIGGPLLCIGDLLSDLGEQDNNVDSSETTTTTSTSAPQPPQSPDFANVDICQSPDLAKLFEENFKSLNEALAGTDHSWTALTLKLCSSVENANKLIQLTNSNAGLLSEKVDKLQEIVKRGDSAVAAARSTCISLNQDQSVSCSLQTK